MSYRSDVRILVNKEGLEVLEQKTIEYAKQYYEANENETWAKIFCKESIMNEWNIIESSYPNEIILEQSDVKWDTDYEDIKWIIKALDDLSKNHLPYQVMELGEDDEVHEDNNFYLFEEKPLQTYMYTTKIFKFC